MDMLLNTFVPQVFNFPKRSFNFFTDVVQYADKTSQSGSYWDGPIRIWGFDYPKLNDSARAKLEELFLRAKGAFRRFKFHDPKDEDGSYSATQTQIAIATATAGGAGTGEFTIAGDYRSKFKLGVTFEVVGSTGNNGDYTCNADATYDGTKTYIIPSEAVADGTDDGNILEREFQLEHTYFAGETEEWTEERSRIQPNCCQVWVNAVLKTEGTHYTLDDNTGVLKFTSGNTPTNTQVITAIFKFYFNVCFVIDTLVDKPIGAGNWQAFGIQLIQFMEPA